MNTMYTTKEFAELSKVTVNTVKLWLKSGKIKGEKIGKQWIILSNIFEPTVNREGCLREMDEAIETSKADAEIGHGMADGILCNMLIDLGYQDVVSKYYEVSKYYA